MIIALYIFGIVAVLAGLLAASTAHEAFQGGDNFGAGFTFSFSVGVCAIAALIWLVLAAIHWWPL